MVYIWLSVVPFAPLAGIRTSKGAGYTLQVLFLKKDINSKLISLSTR